MKNSIDNSFWIERAIIIAKKNLPNTLPIASILVKKNFEIGIGTNFKGKSTLNNKHSEFNAIEQSLFYTSNTQLQKCTVYTTLEPCEACLKLIKSTKIKNIIFSSHKKLKKNISKRIIINKIIHQKNKNMIKKFFKQYKNF